jgi:hypothetical protein
LLDSFHPLCRLGACARSCGWVPFVSASLRLPFLARFASCWTRSTRRANSHAFARSGGLRKHVAGAPGGNRTPDLDVRTVLLYPLSYEGARSRVYCQDAARSGPAGALLLSKLTRFSQQASRAARQSGDRGKRELDRQADPGARCRDQDAQPPDRRAGFRRRRGRRSPWSCQRLHDPRHGRHLLGGDREHRDVLRHDLHQHQLNGPSGLPHTGELVLGLGRRRLRRILIRAVHAR